jgi:GDP-L-fucose synthase
MDKNSRIYVAGHTGLLGSALLRRLKALGYKNLIYQIHGNIGTDLRSAFQTDHFFNTERPEYVFLCAAKVGGIKANNDYPAEFLLDNLTIQNNVLYYSKMYNVKKLVFLGSSCIYPKFAKQPIKEEELLNGKLEPTNEAYAIAKISGIMLCKSMNKQYGTNFVVAMPNNAYGINDNFDLEHSHVLPAMIRKFHEAKIENKDVELWGTGSPKREFVNSDDLASALILIMQKFDSDGSTPIINIGSGSDISIKDLANLISKIVGFKGKIIWNKDYPDGTPRKLLDSSKIFDLCWKPKISLEDGIAKTYEWFVKNFKKG